MIPLILLFLASLAALAQSLPESHCRELNDTRHAADAARCYVDLRAHSNDAKLIQRSLLGSARNHLWSGDGASAVREFEEFLRNDPDNREVIVEFVRLLRYRGAYERAEQLCNRLLQVNPHDAEVLALRSEVLFWAGHRAFASRRDADESGSGIAQVAALEALGLNHAAASQMRTLKNEDSATDMARYLEQRLSEQSRGHSDPAYSVYNDSDGIHDVMSGTSVSIPVHGDHTAKLNVAEFWSSAPTGAFTDVHGKVRVREFSFGGTALVSPGLALTLEAGGSTPLGASSGIRPTYHAAFEGSPWDRWILSIASTREFMKVTPRAVDQGIYSDSLSAHITRWFNSRTSAGIDLDRRWWSDANRSVAAQAVFTRNLVYHRAFNLDAGVLSAHQAYSRDMLAQSGFFTPDHYSRYDGFADVHGEAGGHLVWEFRGEGGTQRITAASDQMPNWGVSARMSWKLGRVLRLYGSYERRNYSLLSRGGWYQGFFASLRVQP